MQLSRITLSLFGLALLALLGCSKTSSIEPATNNWLFTNGRIYTVNPAQPWAEAIIVREGVIDFVGTAAEAEAQETSGLQVVDLAGNLMLPGLHDVHMHPLEASSPNFQFNLSTEETNAENYIADIRAAAQQNPGDDWLLGWGHYLHTVLDANRSPLEILDEAVSDRPVAIMEFTSHSIWCNSRALEAAGYNNSSIDPVGGVLMRDDQGNLNGILIDNAGNALIDMALQPTNTSRENDYFGLLEYGLPQLRANGLTSICDARTYWKRDHHLTWQRLEADGELTARVNLGLWAYPIASDATQLNRLRDLYSNNPNSFLKINQIKLYSDGIVQNTTAAMHDDYHIDLFSKATNNGVNYFTQERIAEYISELEGIGFDFHIHAIGNRGVTESLNAIEQAGSSAGRHRITHVEIVDPSDLGRFQALNVTADAQVAGDFTQPDQWSENDEFIGSAHSGAVIPIRDLTEAGARLTLSSDWDVSTLNPFIGLEHAVTRAPQQISLEQAIQAYTINAAYVMRQEDVVGSIEVGKEADLIILDQNLFEIDPMLIGQTQVVRTYLAGELIFER